MHQHDAANQARYSPWLLSIVRELEQKILGIIGEKIKSQDHTVFTGTFALFWKPTRSTIIEKNLRTYNFKSCTNHDLVLRTQSVQERHALTAGISIQDLFPIGNNRR